MLTLISAMATTAVRYKPPLCMVNHASPLCTKTCVKDDEHFMMEALRQAEAAMAIGEVPIGAVIVRDGIILAAEHNRVESLRDASAHAEMLCARTAAANGPPGGWRLESTTLYCTVEPCPMCLAALHAFRVRRLVYGAPNLRLGAVEGDLWPREGAPHPFHNQMHVTGGILTEPAAELMRSFFRSRRQDTRNVLSQQDEQWVDEV